MSWRKYFTPVDTELSPISGLSNLTKAGPARTNYSSYLPDVYTGSPNRVERYQQYEVMDSDPEVNAALDILAEFCTQKLKDGKSPFTVKWRSKATNSEIRILGEYLQQWNKLQQFDTRIFRVIRNVYKYGDAFFIRDPETQKLSWVDPSKIVKIIVNESDGKKPEQYIIKDLAPNFENLVVTQITPNINSRQAGGGMTSGAGALGSQSAQRGASGPYPSSSTGSRFGLAETEHAIDAAHVVHISLSEGLDNNYPFGNSLLENVFKVYKQKELLEDAVLIYRIQRAPERRVFHIDTGNMPSHMAMAFVERVKNEIHQRRIPSQSGGGCFEMSTRIPLLDGRILSISELALEYSAGKENWAYSCDPINLTIVPGIISWAGITQQSAQVIELILSNGSIIVCTPEHKFPTVNRGEVVASELILHDDSLIGFNGELNPLGNDTIHTVVSSRILDDLIEVGTLTIDGDEKQHAHHTFAIEQGVYTYNSNVIDSAYNPLCLDLLTEIPLLDGRILTLSELISEFEAGKENWAYSCEPTTGKVVPGIINWAGVTRKNADVIKITFDNGKTLTCTPDHKIPVFDKGFVEASELTIDDVLMSFNTRLESVNASQLQQVWDHEAKSWVWTRQLVGDFFKAISKHQEFTYLEENINAVKTVIHNKDGDISNNDPRNLSYMNKKDHISYFNEQFDFDVTGDIEYLEENILPIGKSVSNIRIASIEKVQCMDVGTITIDGTGRWHSYHTFAINSGIFVKNSINEDYFFPMTADGRGSKVDVLPGGCFAMDTQVSLLDGRELSITDIGHELKSGKELWTYSCHPTTGAIVPGLISWAGVTQASAKVMKITLDNGEAIICTPCHKFPQYANEYKRAGNFAVGDSLIPMYRKHETLSNDSNHEYEQIFDNATNNWVFTHMMVAENLKDTRISYNIHNTNVREVGTVKFKKLADTTILSKNGIGDSRMKYWSGKHRKSRINLSASQSKIVWSDKLGSLKCKSPRPVEYSHAILLAVIDMIKDTTAHSFTCNDVINELNNRPELLAKLRELNKFSQTNNWSINDGFTAVGIVDMITQFGYDNWTDFRNKESTHNHRIIAIEHLDEEIEVGTLTIDFDEEFHNYHTFALSAGVMTFNSNLGEIDDLKYFTNKLFRGLRIPSSYLPTGADDSQASFNDGRVGTAYIQELRFNKYCERLQWLMTSVFDDEFKLYMNSRGVNIDANLFELNFNPPMNFASTRQSSLDSERINTFSTIQAIPFMSNRFALKRFLGLTDDEVAENEQLWAEENGKGQATHTDAAGELRSAGLSAAGIAGDLDMATDMSAPDDMEGDITGESGAAPAPVIPPMT